MKGRSPSLGDIAHITRVTVATVSRALANNPRISEATRERVRKAAEELGYRPDPEARRLMAHLRSTRESRYVATIGLINDASTPDDLLRDPYTRRVIAGARDRARELGYVLDQINLREKGMTQERIEKILQTRAIHGVLIPPQVHLPEDVVLPEHQVALVAATAARAHLHLHRVFPDHFDNMRCLLKQVITLGYRRIGLITTLDMEERQRNGSLAAFEWFIHNDPSLRRIPPLIIGRSTSSIRQWFLKYEPEALVAPDDWILDELQNLPKRGQRPAVALFGNQREGFAGIDELPEAIGAASIDLLTAQMLRRETGYPLHPKNVLIGGTFVPGASLPPAPGSRK